MDKDEMKNKISMALKDPILQQGFEIICKNLAELEEANAQWEQRNETLKDALEHARKVYGDDLEKAYKENAELKTDMATAIPLLERAKEISESLTKAKELLKRCMGQMSFHDCEYTEAYKDAEQFLKEE